MLSKPLLRPILDNEALTRGLGDMEARVLVEWLVEQAERLIRATDAQAAGSAIERLCRRARSLSRFVFLWCQARDRRAACQLAAVERFPWPLPTGPVDPCDLMQWILLWEGEAGAVQQYTASP
ncbi:MAG: hypothetical protein L0Z62_19640 [Gemmataceae bacterium]|nr:hypothetical protein [Gemmataceae bacterium]